MNFTVSPAELDLHALTSTRMYWLARTKTAPAQRAVIALRMADISLRARRPVQALACLRVASRLGTIALDLDGRIAALATHVERVAPVSRLLPASFRYVSRASPEYEPLVEAGEFSRTPLPLRNTAVTIGAFTSSKGITERGIDRLDFMLLRKGVPAVRVEAVVALDEGVSEYGHPVRLQFAERVPPTRLYQVAELTLDVLRELAVRHGANDIQIDDFDHGTMQTVVGRAAAIREYLAELRAGPCVDLTQDEETIWRGVRDSYRPLIRSQSRAIALRHFGSAERDSGVIEAWRCLLMSRGQLNQRVFDFEVQRARDGKAEITGAFLPDGRCASITVVVDDGPLSEYRIGYYVRDDERGKSSHFPVYSSILRARARGQSRYYFSYFSDEITRYALRGELITLSTKGRALHFFKRGFSNTIERKFIFRLVL